MLDGFADTVIPLGALIVRFAASANPLSLARFIVDVAVPPAWTLTGDGEAVREIACAVEVNVAMTVFPKSFGVNVQVSAEPTHDPDQFVKALPVAGTAVSVIGVSASNCALQVGPQFTPAGVEVTVPEPEPAFVTRMPGRAFLIWRVMAGPGPSIASVSPPINANTDGVMVTMLAFAAAAKVTMLEETPGASDAGLNVAVTPVVNTEVARSIVFCDPAPLRVSVTVAVTLLPWTSVRLVGETAIVALPGMNPGGRSRVPVESPPPPPPHPAAKATISIAAAELKHRAYRGACG